MIRSLGASVALALLCACSGDIGSPADAEVDKAAMRFDTVSPDVGKPKDGAAKDGAGKDTAPAKDGKQDTGQTGPCSDWSDWSCKEESTLLCTATCEGESLSCTNMGDCMCGIGSGPCGRYSAASPCEVCKKAWMDGCCAP